MRSARGDPPPSGFELASPVGSHNGLPAESGNGTGPGQQCPWGRGLTAQGCRFQSRVLRRAILGTLALKLTPCMLPVHCRPSEGTPGFFCVCVCVKKLLYRLDHSQRTISPSLEIGDSAHGIRGHSLNLRVGWTVGIKMGRDSTASVDFSEKTSLCLVNCSNLRAAGVG